MLEIYAAVAESLQKWEKRFKLEKVKIKEVKEGKVTLELNVIYLPNNESILLSGVKNATTRNY